MFKTNLSNIPVSAVIGWLVSRVAVIYVVLFLFCISFVDLKMLEMRIKVRHLNAAIPEFSAMIDFSRDQNEKKVLDGGACKKYFELILSYIPDDVMTRQLLGFVDFYMGQEQKAIGLFKGSTAVNGRDLFWSNYNLGVIYYKKGMWSQATEYLFKAVSSNPKLTTILMQNSPVYKQIFANPEFKYSLKDGIIDAQSKAYILLLSSLYNMKQYEKVIVIFNLAVANQDILYKDAFYNYAALALLEEGQAEKSFLLFQRSLTVEKNNPSTYYYMAMICQKAGQLEQARDFLQISYALHQKNDPRFPYENHVDLRFF